MGATKKLFAFLLVIAATAVMSGCGAQNDRIEIDISDLSRELLQKAEFEDELNPIGEATTQKLYDIDTYVAAEVYLSSGAPAEEIAVFEFDSTEDAAAGLKKAQVRIEEQKANYESYIPKEIPKLDHAIVKQLGQYVVVCVSNGDEAENILTQYINQQNEG